MKNIYEFCVANKIVSPNLITVSEGRTVKFLVKNDGKIVESESRRFYFPIYSNKTDDVYGIYIWKLENGKYDLKLHFNVILHQLTLEEVESKLLEFVKENECAMIEEFN